MRRERWNREDANGGNIIKTPNFSVFFWRLGCCTLSWLYTGVFFCLSGFFFFCLDLRLLVALTLVCSFTFVLFFFLSSFRQFLSFVYYEISLFANENESLGLQKFINRVIEFQCY